MPGLSNRNFALALAGIFGLALAVCAAHLSGASGSPLFGVLLGDAEGYDAWARRIAGGDWIGSQVFYQAPLYPYFLASIYSLGGGYVLALACQAFLHALSCVLLAEATGRFVSRAAGILAGIMLALYAPAIFYVGLLQKSTLALFFVCLALFLLGRAMERRTLRGWLLLGLALGCLTLARENAFVFVPALLVWLAIRRGAAFGRRMIFAGVLLAGVAAILIPVATRNYVVGGGFYLTSSQFGPNFYIGNNERATGQYRPLRAGHGHVAYERSDATELAERALGQELTPAQVSSYWTSQALGFIREQPVAWLRLLFAKLALAANGVEVMDTEDQYTHARWSWPLRFFGGLWHFGVVLPLALLGMMASWPTRERLAPLYFMLAGYATSLLMFYILGRYRLPLVPVLLVFAAAGATQARDLWRRSQALAKLGAALGLLAVAVLANWPLMNRDLLGAVTFDALGSTLLHQGRGEEAIPQFEEALRIKPDYADAHDNLGRALASSGRGEEAVGHFRRALQIRPDYAEAHYNWGSLLHGQGRIDEAVRHYEQTLRLDPEHFNAHNNWAGALLGQGRPEEAIVHFREALRIKPDLAMAHNNLASILGNLGRYEEAISHCSEAVRIKPDFAMAQNNWASLLVSLGRFEEAIQHCERALQISPRLALAHDNCGNALRALGRGDEAAEHYEQASRIRAGR